MASLNMPAEPIISEPVTVETSTTQTATADDPAVQTQADLSKQQTSPGYSNIYTTFPRQVRPIRDTVAFGESPDIEIRERRYPGTIRELTLLTNTVDLEGLLEKPDVCVETLYTGRVSYIVNHAFHSADVQKLSWLFLVGKPDAWVQKPTSFSSTASGFHLDLSPADTNRDRFERYDDRHDRPDLPIVRLGCALRVFKDDTAASLTSKVKFVTVVQCKSGKGLVRLVISHSRQAAATDIVHEMLNGFSIIFVGAVLKDLAIPVEFSYNRVVPQFQRVGSVEEAEAVGEGVVGIIC